MLTAFSDILTITGILEGCFAPFNLMRKNLIIKDIKVYKSGNNGFKEITFGTCQIQGNTCFLVHCL